MSANSKVAILVVSMFLLTALAPAVTVFCGSDEAAADTDGTDVVNGMVEQEVTALTFTEKTSDYSSLVYLSDEFPVEYTEENITDWVYSETYGYWVSNNEIDTDKSDGKNENYGHILTYGYFSMSEDQIRQDIVDNLFRDNIINENGVKYNVTGSTIEIGSGLPYEINTTTRDITITLGASWSVKAIYDQVGRDITATVASKSGTVPALSGSDISFTFGYDGLIKINDGSATPTLLTEFAYELILSDGVSTYVVMRNVDQSIAKFQLLQASFMVESECKVNITVKKSTAATVSETIAADKEFAGCYFSELQYGKLYVIDNNDGDIRPQQVSGTYEVIFNDITNGVNVNKDVTVGNPMYYIYGTVVDSEGSKTGTTVVNPLYGAKVTYMVTRDNGETYTDSSTVSSVTDDSGEVAGFFRMSAEYGSNVTVSDVEVKGYSFADKSYSVANVNHDISPYEADCVITATEKTQKVTVTDKSGNPAANCVIRAKFWFEYGGHVYDTYPEEATGDKGSLPAESFTTDENGNANISFKEPTGIDNFILLAYCDSGKDDIYTFDIDDTSDWTSKAEIPALEKEGNIVVASKKTACKTEIFAKESSFDVTVYSANGRDLENASINASWYYRNTDSGSKNTTKLWFTPTSTESAGKIKTVTTATDSEGVIRLAYLTPVFDEARWQPGSGNIASCFIYIYGTGYVFDYVTNVTDITTDPDTTGHEGCIKDNYYGSAKVFGSYDIVSEDNLYVISGTITAHTGTVPYSVRMHVSFKSGTPSTIEKWFYRSDSTSESTIEYEFSMVGGRSPDVKMFSDGYTFTATSPSLGTIKSDKEFNFVSDYTGSSGISRIPSVPIGIVTGYVVSVLKEGDIIRYAYTVGGNSCSTLVRVQSGSTSSTYVVRGKAGMGVSITATDTSENRYISEFDSEGKATVINLVMTNNVLYKNNKESMDTLLSGVSISIYYKDELFGTMTSDSSGVCRIKVPDDTANVKYYYEGYSITAKTDMTGKYAGFYGFDLTNYVSKNLSRIITVTIEYYATSSIDNMSSAKSEQIMSPTTTEIAIGAQKVFVAPDLNGFKFAGWYFEGQSYSDSDNKTCTFTAAGTMDDDVTLCAYYSAVSVEEAEKGVDTTVMIIGIIAIVVAVLALVYVVFQSKRF